MTPGSEYPEKLRRPAIHAALLPRLIGWGSWLVVTAENIDAPTALAWGLVDVVAPETREKVIEMLLESALRSQKALGNGNCR